MQQLPQTVNILLSEWNRIEIQEGALYCQKPNEPRQLILPSKLKPIISCMLKWVKRGQSK